MPAIPYNVHLYTGEGGGGGGHDLESCTHPDTVKHEGEAFRGQPVPVAERVHDGPRRANAQLSGVKQPRRQLQQSLVRAVVIQQLRHLQNHKHEHVTHRRPCQ